MKISPSQWGPPIWKCIHYVALGYPNEPTDDIKISYIIFLTALKDVIPCKICSTHYEEYLNKFPLDDNVMSSKTTLFNWTVDLHNDVNIRSNKPTFDYDTALKLLTCEIKETPKIQEIENPSKKTNYNIYLIILIISLILIAILYKKYN